MISLMLRLPEDLHKALKELAQKDNRSLNSEMIHILKRYIEQAMKEQEKP